MSPSSHPTSAPPSNRKPKPRMSTRNRLLFFFTAWLIVLMPFLFWWNTWFGRQLSDKQLSEYLQDDKKPRHIQHALVQPAKVTAPQPGKITDSATLGTAIHQGGIIAKLESGGQTTEVRSPISGRLRDLSVKAGQTVAAGEEIATLDPGIGQIWEAMRALYLIGRPEDIPAIQPYERDLPETPDHVRKQAMATEQAIRE